MAPYSHAMKKILVATLLSVFLLSACGGGDAPAAAETKPAPKKPRPKNNAKAASNKDALAAAEAASVARREAAELERKQGGILIVGDNLSSGENLSSDQSWPGLLQRKLTRAESDVSVVNVSISSNDAAGGVSRIGWQLGKYNPKLVVVALGSRDFRFERDLGDVQKNLSSIIRTAKANDAQVLLIGASAPSSVPEAYQSSAQLMYRNLASQENVLLVPDLMTPLNRILAVNPEFAANAQGSREIQPALVDHVWPTLQQAIKQAGLEENESADATESAPADQAAKNKEAE